MTKYASIWNEIKRTGKVTIAVRTGAASTDIQGVLRTKSAENTARRGVGLSTWSKLVITKEPGAGDQLRITLELLYSSQL